MKQQSLRLVRALATAAIALTMGCETAAGPSRSDFHLLAAGDIADCSSSGDEATASLLDTLPGTIATLGDNVYPFASQTNFEQCFAPSWGRQKARIKPAAGNHEYEGGQSESYFAYFGAAAGPAGKGWYSYDLGAWHVVVLNAELPINAGSEQMAWLQADLAASTAKCTLAYWHEPRFSSGPHGDSPGLQALWQALYDEGVEIVLNGHDHEYERFAPQTPSGQSDPTLGIREFVVGTGGGSHYQFVTAKPNSEFRNDTDFGVLHLMLWGGGYHWQFVATDGKVRDSGDGACH